MTRQEIPQTGTHKLLILILMFFLVALPVLSSFTNSWGEWGNDESNRGFIHDDAGHFTSSLGNVLTRLGDGMDFQPLAVNLTGSQNNELILFSGNYLQLYDSELNLIDEISLGLSNKRGQPTAYWNGSETSIVLNTYNSGIWNYSVWRYNSSNEFEMLCNITDLPNLTQSDFNGIGTKCHEGYCYTLMSSKTPNNDKWNLVKINMSPVTSCSYSSVNNTEISNNIKFEDGSIPAISDIDRDGSFEAVFVCDDDSSGSYGLCVFDLNASGGSPFLDTSFSGDGIIDDIDTQIGGVLVYNIDGSGDEEIIISYVDGSSDLTIQAYKSDGSVLWTAKNGSINSGFVSSPVVAELGGSGSCEGMQSSSNSVCVVLTTQSACNNKENIFGQEICEWTPDGAELCVSGSVSGGTEDRLFMCVDNQGATQRAGLIDAGGSGFNKQPLIAADMDNDGIDDLIASNCIAKVLSNGSIELLVNLTNGHNGYFVSVVDMNGDNELEVLSTRVGYISISYSGFNNALPTVFSSITFGRDKQTPVCLGSTVTFTATENTHYSNDGSEDTERLSSTCGNGTTTFNGDFSLSSPSLACQYNSVGTFVPVVYLQDSSNSADLTQSKSFSFVVINGTAGVTCDLAVSGSVITGESVSSAGTDITTSADIQDVTSSITGQDPVVEAILVMFFTVALLLGLAWKGKVQNPFVYIISLGALWLGFVIIGWLNLFIFILFAIVLLVTGMLSVLLGSKND